MSSCPPPSLSSCSAPRPSVLPYELVALACVAILSSGCPGDPVPGDVVPPQPVRAFSVESGGGLGAGTLKLTWQDPDDGDLAHITLSYSPSGGTPDSPFNVEPGKQVAVVTELLGGQRYDFVATAVDLAGNVSEQSTAFGAPPQDQIAPAEVSDVQATARDGAVELRWTDPPDPDLDHIQISFVPGGSQSLSVAPGVEYCLVEGLDNGVGYTFVIKAVDSGGNRSTGVKVSAEPMLQRTLNASIEPISEAEALQPSVRLTLDGLGGPHVVYAVGGSSTARTVHYGYRAGGANGWPTSVVEELDAPTVGSDRSANTMPAIAIDGTNRVHVVYRADGNALRVASKTMVDTAWTVVPVGLYGSVLQIAPDWLDVAVDAADGLHIVYRNEGEAGWRGLWHAYVVTGETTKNKFVVADPAEDQFRGLDPGVLVSGDDVYLVAGGSSELLLSHCGAIGSTDNADWQTSVLLRAQDASNGPFSHTSLTVGPAGGLHAVFADQGADTLRHGWSDADGSWTFDDVVSQVGARSPGIAVDTEGGVHVVYVSGGPPYAVKLAYRPPGLARWLTDTLDELDFSSSEATATDIAISSEGDLHVVYVDEPTAGTRRVQYAYGSWQ